MLKPSILLLSITFLLSCKNADHVYLCNGPQSKVYHKTIDCQGLRKCSTDVESTDLATAKNKQRRACRACF